MVPSLAGSASCHFPMCQILLFPRRETALRSYTWKPIFMVRMASKMISVGCDISDKLSFSFPLGSPWNALPVWTSSSVSITKVNEYRQGSSSPLLFQNMHKWIERHFVLSIDGCGKKSLVGLVSYPGNSRLQNAPLVSMIPDMEFSNDMMSYRNEEPPLRKSSPFGLACLISQGQSPAWSIKMSAISNCNDFAHTWIWHFSNLSRWAIILSCKQIY